MPGSLIIRCPFLLFCSVQPKCKKKYLSVWDHPKLGWAASCAQVPIAVQAAIAGEQWFSFPSGLYTRASEGRCWFLSDEGRKAAQGHLLSLMICLCWIYLHTFSALTKTEWALFGSILALLKGSPFPPTALMCSASPLLGAQTEVRPSNLLPLSTLNSL